MVTQPDVDIAFTIPTIIVTPSDTVESVDLYSNNQEVQNPFTIKCKTDQMSSKNNPKMTMKKISEMTPQSHFPEQILYSAKKTKTNIPSRKPENDKTPTAIVGIYNNLKYIFSKVDGEIICLQRSTKRIKRKSHLK